MSRPHLRLGFGFVACLALGFGGACSEGIGGRCVQDSDCASGHCSMVGISTEGGRCAEPGTNVVDTGVSTPQDATADAVSDAAGTPDATASDAQPATDAAPTDAASDH